MKYRTELMDSVLTSPAAQRIIDYITPIYRNGYVALWMFQAIGVALDALIDFSEGLSAQTSSQTATWSIENWEAEYGIPSDIDQPLEQRRANVVTRINTSTPANPAVLAQYATAAGGVPCEIVENVAKNTFAIVMHAENGNVAAIRAAINEAKPAHLIYIIETALQRETTNSIYAASAGSYNKRYPNVAVSNEVTA